MIEEYMKQNNINWEVQMSDGHIFWGNNQEWAVITNDVNYFNSHLNYITLQINY